MANEAVLIVETGPPMFFTVADGTGIEKGTLLKMTDPRTAIIHTSSADAVAGIAAEEKIASDGKTTLAVYREGQFRVLASGAITVGDAVGVGDTANDTHAVPINHEFVLGIALETAANNETYLIELKPMTFNLA